MDAVRFLKESKRLCKKSYDKEMGCGLCIAHDEENDFCMIDVNCHDSNSKSNYKDAVEIVEKWMKMNPNKTRMQDFIEKFPNAKINDHGFPKDTCCMCVGYCESCDKAYPSETDCYFCWKKELED